LANKVGSAAKFDILIKDFFKNLAKLLCYPDNFLNNKMNKEKKFSLWDKSFFRFEISIKN
jgi:hypothetical protein